MTGSSLAATFSYRLLKQVSPSAVLADDGLMEVYAFGLPEDQQRRYYLEISAQSNLANYVRLASVDLTLAFDSALFNPVQLTDVELAASPLSEFQRRAVVNSPTGTSTIRFAAGSAEDIVDGAGHALGESIGSAPQVLSYVAFDLNDTALAALLVNEGYLNDNITKRAQSAGFQLTANLDETVFTDLSSLRDKQNDGYAYAASGLDVKAAAVTLQLSQQSAHRFGTQRTISLADGNSGFTNLIREGDTVTSTVNWKNTGDVSVTGINLQLETYANAVLSVDAATTQVSVGQRAADGSIIESNREEGTITLSLLAGSGTMNGAGTVIDMSSAAYTIEEASTYFDWVGKGSKNLITYQGDLNYDGRVSMKDLAYLNAGAALKAASGVVAGDVDADHDGAFTIADLDVLDQQWGQSLHTASQAFTGDGQIAWSALSSQTVLNEQSVGMAMAWDNPNFEQQNTLEATGVFDPTPFQSRPAEERY